MARTSANPVHRRNSGPPSRTFPRAVVKLRGQALKDLFEAEGVKSLRGQVAELNHSSIAALSRAYDDGAVSAFLIAAVRLRFPHVPYEQLFTESEESADARTQAAA
jgi:hypothetical protein